MRYHLSIAPFGEYKDTLSKILNRVQHDPCVLHLDQGNAGHALVFCYSDECAALEREHLQTTGRVSPSLCALVIDQYGIRVSQECAEVSRMRMAEFVKWILREFAPCRVFDEDTGEEISDLASKDPQSLFIWKR